MYLTTTDIIPHGAFRNDTYQVMKAKIKKYLLWLKSSFDSLDSTSGNIIDGSWYYTIYIDDSNAGILLAYVNYGY